MKENKNMIQTAFKDGKSVVIYADHRELGSKVASILKKHCDLREQQLDVPDYLLSDRVACERKTAKDFVASIMDQRLFAQLSNMKQFPSPVLLIEGEEVFDTGINMHPNAIRGALASIIVDYSIPIIWTKTPLESAQMLYTIAKREQLQEKRSIAIRGKRPTKSTNQEQEFLVSGLPGVSTVKGKNLLKHFLTPEKIFAANEKQLQQVEGIGEGMAKRIRQLLSKKYEKSILED